MNYPFVYLGEDYKNYISISQKKEWGESIVISESQDKRYGEYVLLAERELLEIKSFGEESNLKILEEIRQFFTRSPYFLHYKNESLLLGQEKEKNKRELDRFSDFFFESEVQKEIHFALKGLLKLSANFQISDFYSPYWICSKQKLNQVFREEFVNNEGMYVEGEIKKLDFVKKSLQSVVLSSYWGRVQGNHYFYSSYERLRNTLFDPSAFDMTSFRVCRYILKSEQKLFTNFFISIDEASLWSPLSVVRNEGGNFIFDIYFLNKETIQSSKYQKSALKIVNLLMDKMIDKSLLRNREAVKPEHFYTSFISYFDKGLKNSYSCKNLKLTGL